jgi:beta-glucanase (GH16 family)
MTEGFHNYGVLIEDQETIFYYDGVELRRMKTLPEAKVPLYLVVDLAMGGGGQSMDQAANPSCLQVEHIRVYSKE